jgi:thioredoxin reductase
VELRSGAVLGGGRDGAGFVLDLADGSSESARRVLFATGMDFRFLAVPGTAERWGRSLFHGAAVVAGPLVADAVEIDATFHTSVPASSPRVMLLGRCRPWST